jgi:site-specific DNA recombinase
LNAVIYARYSSHGQTEQSIEGQLKACYEYAKQNGYNVIREPYIDRAQSGTSDKRKNFQKMISDSAKQQFEVVLCYQYDRFARNRYDSATYKAKLKKNGVKVISVRENLTDDASGVFMEAVLEGMAEYYSTELSQKVKRGIAISVDKCKFIGGFIPLGYALTEDKYYIIDPLTAPIITRIFELYASGHGLKEIAIIIKKEFNKDFGNPYNSIGRILDNINYIGTYTRGGNIVENAIPRLVSDELFHTAQAKRAKQKKTPATARAYEDYILTTKLYCGYDHEMMVGTGGTSKSGTIYHYYGCKNAIKKKGCKKRNVKKSYIEDFIVLEARKQLTDENIDMIVQAVCEASKQENNAPHLAEIKRNIKENAKAIDNLLDAIERGENLDLYNERLTKRRQEKTELETMLAKAQYDTRELDEKEVKFFFHQLQKGYIDDERSRKALVEIFINSVYLYDDRARIIFNATDRPITIDCDLLNEIETLENGGVSVGERCSYMKDTAPPTRINLLYAAKVLLYL